MVDKKIIIIGGVLAGAGLGYWWLSKHKNLIVQYNSDDDLPAVNIVASKLKQHILAKAGLQKVLIQKGVIDLNAIPKNTSTLVVVGGQYVNPTYAQGVSLGYWVQITQIGQVEVKEASVGGVKVICVAGGSKSDTMSGANSL